jgi:hypothetical protein
MSPRFDKEKTKKVIAMVLENIKTDADLELLNEYHSLFKKEVSLFDRSKAAAYLLMLCAQGKNARGPRVLPPESGKNAKRPAPQKAGHDEERYPLPEEESVQLFFSAGRSRRGFPREILGLIYSKTAISKEDIGAIRILDNYSFVQVRQTIAEKIIETLNGTSFRGRLLTVNYAKNRSEEAQTDGGFSDSE